MVNAKKLSTGKINNEKIHQRRTTAQLVDYVISERRNKLVWNYWCIIKAVKTRRVRTKQLQGRTYLTKRKQSSLVFVAHIFNNYSTSARWI